MAATVETVTHADWVDAIGVPAWVTSKDRSILHLNSRAEMLFGCSASDCVGRRCYEVFGTRTRSVSKSGVSRAFCRLHCPIQLALERGRELPPSDVHVIGSGHGQWIHLLPVPVRGDDGATSVLHCALPRDKEHRLETYIGHLAGRSPHPCPACLKALSPREQAVLQLLAEDLTLGEIAERLGVSYVTVRNHVQHVLAKLCAHSTAEAIAVYLLGPSDQKSTVMPKRCVSPSASGSKR